MYAKSHCPTHDRTVLRQRYPRNGSLLGSQVVFQNLRILRELGKLDDVALQFPTVSLIGEILKVAGMAL
jgi:hypothetical protein